jgi:hypothetical protein
MKVTVIVSCLFLLVLTWCTRERPSRIVKLVEDSGAGSLADVSTPDMRLWLKGHPQIATRVDALCAPARSSATAAWAQTTEGRLCAAARVVEAEGQPRRNPDNSGFLPGWK